MPARTNLFQKLIYVLRSQIASDASVTESRFLIDRVTGMSREVDICIEGIVGGHPVTIAIECRDRSRPADITWVQEMHAKHQNLPTNALILVSRRGFTRDAQKDAEIHGIQVLTLHEAEETDFPVLLRNSKALVNKLITLRVIRTLAEVISDAAAPSIRVSAMPDTLVYSKDFLECCPLQIIVQSLMQNPVIKRQIFEQAATEHRSFTVGWNIDSESNGVPLFFRKDDSGDLHRIAKLELHGAIEVETSAFGVNRAKLGDLNVAWGELNLGGKSALIVACDSGRGQERISMTTW